MVVLARPAERALSSLLPRAVGLLAAATLGTGSIAAIDQRGNAEVAAVQAFRDELRPIAEAVFDHVQPLAEAERQVDDDDNGGFSVYVDVSRDATFGNAVRVQREAFDALPVPGSLRAVARRLDVALERFADAAERYEGLPFTDTTGTVSLGSARQAAMDRLQDGLVTWSAAVGALYRAAPPAVPVPLDDDAEPVRRPVSHAGYLVQAGRACGRADATGEGEQDEPTDAASAQRTAAVEAVEVRALVRGLLAVPAPSGDRARLERDVLVPLREYGRLADVLDRLAASSTTPEALFRELVAADTAGTRVAAGLGDYGSQTCALLFGS